MIIDDEDLNDIYEAVDGVVAKYTEQAYAHPSINTVDITGLDDFEYGDFGERLTNKPTFRCAASYFSNLKQGDKLSHSDVDYQIVEWNPNGDGEYILSLARV